MSALSMRAEALRRAMRGAARQPGAVFVALLLSTLACVVLLATLQLAPWGWSLLQRLQALQSAEATVFVAPGAPGTEIKALIARVEQQAGVAAVTHVPRDEALASLTRRPAGSGPLPELKSNPLPDALVVRFDARASPAAVDAAVAALRKLPRVDSVHHDGRWHARMVELVRLGLGAGLTLAIAALLAIGLALVAAVRLVTSAQVAEIRVLRLVGATDATIVRPYAYLGGGLLLLAALLAGAGLLLAQPMMSGPVVGMFAGDLAPPVDGVPLEAKIAGFVAVASLFGAACGALAGHAGLRRSPI